jgi:hypothetical protein
MYVASEVTTVRPTKSVPAWAARTLPETSWVDIYQTRRYIPVFELFVLSGTTGKQESTLHTNRKDSPQKP